MRIFSGVLAAALLALAGAAAADQPAVSPPGRSVSAPESTRVSAPASLPLALQRGLDAYQSGRSEAAIAALGEAASAGDPTDRFVAEFYLARVHSEHVAVADHTKAFVLFRKLADENLTVDPETSPRAPFVARALIALAAYLRVGLNEIGLAPNPRRAADYLHHAAVYFGDKDAQFELARTYLAADGPATDDTKRGLHYLSALAEESHPPAQALLAELFWRGRHVKKDDRRALALATLAAENAPAHERIWIEETYAAVFCAIPQPTREEAGTLAARWRKMFAEPAPEPVGLAGARDLLPERRCASGERVAVAPRPDAPAAKADLKLAAPSPGAVPNLVPLRGAPPSASLFAAGILEAAAKK